MDKSVIFTTRLFVLLCLSILMMWTGDLEAGDGLETPFILSVQDDTLSVHISRVPLGHVLAELNHQTNVGVLIYAAAADDEIWGEFKDLPLEEGIKQLLKHHSYILRYRDERALGDDGHAMASIVKIEVLDSESGAANEGIIAFPEKTNGIESMQGLEALKKVIWEDPDPSARTAALMAIADHSEDMERLEFETIIAVALQDTDLEARKAALYMLYKMDVNAPTELLIKVARFDSSPKLRMEALELIAYPDQEEALDAIKQALEDSDPQVRERALALLGELEALQREQEMEIPAAGQG